MTAPATVASATRRLALLTALRWLPVGLVAPVFVLLAQERGLSLTQVGLVLALHSVLVIALELPTGGVADAVGRRRVLVAAGVLHLVSCVVLVAATGLAGFVLATVLKAVGRALDSGPLEAWYVDTVHRLDPAADVTPGLGWRGLADGGGLALGAALGAVLPALVAESLAVPIALAAAVDAGYVLAVLPLVDEPARTTTAAAPRAVLDTARSAVRDPALRLVLVLTALGGVALSGIELLGPLRFAELAGGREEAAAAFGVVLALSFAAAGLAAPAAAAVRRALRGSTALASAALTLLGAVGIAVGAEVPLLLVAGAGVVAFYVGHGAVWPLLSAVSHARATSAVRATVVSALSLSLALGGTVGSALLPPVAGAVGTSGALLVTAVLALVTAALSLRLDADALLHPPRRCPAPR